MARKMECKFCKDKGLPISYKAPWALTMFLNSEYGIKSRFLTKTCNKHQRLLEKEIKRARIIGLLPFVWHHSQIEIKE